MAKQCGKIAVIGLDCCLPDMILKYADEGELPNIKKLIDKGFFAEDCLCPLPTITPPNWATIATGAWPGTHGITCFHYHMEGTNPDNTNIRQAWSSDRWQAEAVWEAADKAGKKSIIMSYPGAWPPKITNGIVVGGEGFIPGDKREGLPGLEAEFTVAQDFVVTTGYMPYSVRGTFEEADDWKNIPENLADEAMALIFHMPAEGSASPIDPNFTLWALATQSDGNEFDTISLCTEKDYNTALFHIKVGEWSQKLITRIPMVNGASDEVFFRCKLLELSDDADDFKMLVGAMIPTDGRWCSKPEYASVMLAGDACLHRSAGMHMYSAGGVIDFQTYLEMSREISRWMGQASAALMRAIPDWAVYYLHSHPCDWFYHAAITDMVSPDPVVRQRAWDGQKYVYKHEDEMVGAIVEAAGKDAIIAMTSDHGAVPDGPAFNPFDALIPAGLVHMTEPDPNAPELTEMQRLTKRLLGHVTVDFDWKNTKAVPQRETYVYVNLKGRDPNGSVDPADYAKVQQEIIDALLTYRDPRMDNRRPVALALTKEDARILGLYGDRIGDVVYAINPEWGAQHGAILPTARWSVGQLQTLFMLCGPGIKKGVRMQKPCRLVDLVPTLCYASGLPFPADVEGGIVMAALTDPNGPQHTIEKLQKSLDSLESAMERSQRQPWEKHDCA